MPSNVTFKVNRTQMDRALRSMAIVSNRLPHLLVNQAVHRASQKAVWYVPVVSAERISAEWGEEKRMDQVKLKSGRFSRAKKHIKSFFRHPGLAKWVHWRLAHGHKVLGYSSSPFKGVSRAEGAQRMLEVVRRIFGAKQKSRGYFKAAFATLRDAFKRAAGGRIPFSSAASRGSGTQKSLARDLGRIASASPARAGQGYRARATFAIISPRHDIKGAIYKYAQPAIQRGFDEEAAFLMKKSFELELRKAARAAGIRTR